MNLILGVVIILILLFLINNYKKKKRKQRLVNNIRSSWGNPKDFSDSRFDLIKRYFENTEQENDIFHRISDRTVRDLNIDDVFKVIDRTSSKVGQQYLYYKIRNIGNQNDLSDFHDLTMLFEKNEDLRLKSQIELTKLNNYKTYYFEELITSEPIKKPKSLWIVYMLSFMSLLFLVLGFYSPIYYLFIAPIFAVNSVIHYRNKWKVSSYINAASQLPLALSVSRNLVNQQEIKDIFPNTNFINEVEKIERKSKFLNIEKSTDNEVASLILVISELLNLLFNLEYLMFYSFIDTIINNRFKLKKMFHFIGEIDAAISTASLKSSEYKLCNPIFVDSNKLIIKSISHPLIEDCVTNNLTLEDNSLLLTGSNMSGKTTFIRNIAINSLLAQTLNICFAEEYSAPFFKMYSSIRIEDDLLDDKSYYLAEVLIIKELIEISKQNSPCLFVLDEIFKGTNTIERIAGGKAILSYLNNDNNMVLVSTHDIELTEILRKEKYKLYHFSEQIDNDELLFDYKLKDGELKSRNAIKILELHDYPSEVIADARATEISAFENNL